MSRKDSGIPVGCINIVLAVLSVVLLILVVVEATRSNSLSKEVRLAFARAQYMADLEAARTTYAEKETEIRRSVK